MQVGPPRHLARSRTCSGDGPGASRRFVAAVVALGCVASSGALTAGIATAAHAAAAGEGGTGDGGSSSASTVQPENVPELLAVGHGRAMGACFVEVHMSGSWPPSATEIERWVMVVRLQLADGTSEIRWFESRDLDAAGLRATRPDGQKMKVELIEEDDAMPTFRWSCAEAPRTVEVDFEITDTEGRTLLSDSVSAHKFVDEARGPGDVPAEDLYADDEGDLYDLATEQELERTAAAVNSRGGTDTVGGLLLVAIVLLIGWVAYLVWWDRNDPSVD